MILNKVKIVCFVLLSLSIAISFSFALNSTELVERAKETTVFVIVEFEIDNNIEKKTGTGFVIDTTKSPGLVIVTNRHIFEYETEDKLIKKPYKITAKVNLSKLEPTFCNARIIALHDSYDLALLYPENMIKVPKDVELKIASDRQYYTWKTTNFLLEDSIIDDSDIKEGLDVYFSGYPLGLGSERIKNWPITRKGIIAQIIPGEEEFIVDGFASPGNSGSPVYSLIGKSIRLLGIQRGIYTESGYDRSNPVMVNSGLSVIIKASVIKDFIYELIDKGVYKGDWSN